MMLMKLSIVVLLCSLLGYLVHESNGQECEGCLDCNWSPCFDHSYQTIVKLVWQHPQNLTDNLNELKCAVLSLVDNAGRRHLAYLLGMSLWSIHFFVEMSDTLQLTCVFAELVKQTIISKLSDDECARAKLDEAKKNYTSLADRGLDNAVNIGMALGGCPVDSPKGNSSAPCAIGSKPAIVLSESPEIPKSLVPVLIKLLESDQLVDQAIATIAFGVGTTFGIDFFDSILDNETFRKAVQLKVCPMKIDKRCCSKQKTYFLHIVSDVKKFYAVEN